MAGRSFIGWVHLAVLSLTASRSLASFACRAITTISDRFHIRRSVYGVAVGSSVVGGSDTDEQHEEILQSMEWSAMR